MVMIVIFVLDAKMGGSVRIGKGKQIPQGDLEGIGIGNCEIGTGLQIGFLCLEKNQKRERPKRNLEKGKV